AIQRRGGKAMKAGRVGAWLGVLAVVVAAGGWAVYANVGGGGGGVGQGARGRGVPGDGRRGRERADGRQCHLHGRRGSVQRGGHLPARHRPDRRDDRLSGGCRGGGAGG